MLFGALLVLWASENFEEWICSLAVVWIFEVIVLIYFFLFFFFFSISLRCNCATLALTSVAKENEEVIIWLKECPSFSSLLYNMILY